MVIDPSTRSGEAYVSVTPSSQYCSSPRLHGAQWRHESTITPTAAIWPALNFFTALPTAVTRPTISCPGTMG